MSTPVTTEITTPTVGEPEAPSSPTTGTLRLGRVLLLGLPLALFGFWLVVQIEQIDSVGLPTGLAIYYHVVVMLWIATIANGLLRRVSPAQALRGSELLCIYAMMAVGSSFACWEALGTLLPSLAYPATQAHGQNTVLWQSIVSKLPDWAVIHQQTVAKPVWQGGGLGTLWHGWFKPLALWGALIAVLQAMYIGLTRLLWKPWAVNERLSFPLTRLPLAIVDPKDALWRSSIFWLGFGIAAAIDLFNGLHQLYPAIPYFNDKVTVINQMATQPGWRAVGAWRLTFHPLMLGLGFLLPTDLSFSTWFFFVVGNLQKFIAGELGIAQGSGFSFGGNVPGLLEQNVGAFLVLAASWLLGVRAAFKQSFHEALHGNREELASWVLLLGGSAVWLVALYQLGLPLAAAVLTLALMLMMALFVTRLRAEMGLPVHNLQGEGADTLAAALLGPHVVGGDALIAFADLHAITRSQQGDPMPHQMEGAYMASRWGALDGRYWVAVGLAGGLTALIGPWILLHAISIHGLGGINGSLVEAWNQLPAKLNTAAKPDQTALGEVAAGIFVTIGLIALRRFWPASPFHPLGYAICGSWGTAMIATPVAIAWLVKVLILRYGGIRGYRAALPFALGLILGEFVLGAFWSAVAMLLHQQTYQIWLY